ncbi:MAG: hypothetical protein AAF492_24750, partial [Verrucomicrobiota bacterium]
MRKWIRLLLILWMGSRVAPSNAQVFVDVNTPAPPGSRDGLSWTTAFENLQDAFDVATTQAVWVAEGTYTNSATYTLSIDGTEVLGGFTNGMMSAAERDPAVHRSMLDGEHARRVLQVSASDCILDGLTMANGFVTNGGSGGGILYDDTTDLGNFTLRDCVI